LNHGASISIHVYSANIGAVRRHVHARETGTIKSFVSGCSNSVIPNLWDRSAEMRAG
jgi:predicted metal-dependent enzyme (double-stranded beta helix superfamily)